MPVTQPQRQRQNLPWHCNLINLVLVIPFKMFPCFRYTQTHTLTHRHTPVTNTKTTLAMRDKMQRISSVIFVSYIKLVANPKSSPKQVFKSTGGSENQTPKKWKDRKTGLTSSVYECQPPEIWFSFLKFVWKLDIFGPVFQQTFKNCTHFYHSRMDPSGLWFPLYCLKYKFYWSQVYFESNI